MTIIFTLFICLVIIGISFGLSRVLTYPYCAVEKFVGWITYPFSALYMLFSMIFNKIKTRITKKPPKVYDNTGDWGGLRTVLFIVAIAVASAGLFAYLFLTTPDVQDFFEIDVMFNTPGLYYLGLINSIVNGENLFSLGNLLEMSLISFMQIAFFRKINDDIELFPKIIYNTVFYIFSMGLAFVLPSEIFLMPLNIITSFPDFFTNVASNTASGHWWSAIPLIMLLILYLHVLIFAGHTLLSCICIALREFCASLVFSLPALGLLLIVTIVINTYFPKISDPIAYIILGVLTIASVLFTEFWREHCIDEYSPFY